MEQFSILYSIKEILVRIYRIKEDQKIKHSIKNSRYELCRKNPFHADLDKN